MVGCDELGDYVFFLIIQFVSTMFAMKIILAFLRRAEEVINKPINGKTNTK